MDLTELSRAIERATNASKMVKATNYSSLFRDMVGDRGNNIKPLVEKVKYRLDATRDNTEFINSAIEETYYITYAAYFVLLINYSQNISLFFEPYSPSTIESVCEQYRTKYKPHIVSVKANFDILEDEYNNNKLFQNEENIYTSLDQMLNDVRALKQYHKEVIQYKGELDRQKKIEDEQNARMEKDKTNNYLLQISLAVVVLGITPFYGDIYNYGKKLLTEDGDSESKVKTGKHTSISVKRNSKRDSAVINNKKYERTDSLKTINRTSKQ